MKFHINLQVARIQAEYTRKEMAVKLGVSYPTYANYERGTREPTLETLAEMANVLGVTADYLIGRTSSELEAKANIKKDDPYYFISLLPWFNQNNSYITLSFENDFIHIHSKDTNKLITSVKAGALDLKATYTNIEPFIFKRLLGLILDEYETKGHNIQDYIIMYRAFKEIQNKK